MSRSAYLRCNGRRRGQALLLAILVMVFAALIGVTFITVVAINIGQTGREEERDKARQAAQAGLAFVNLQLTNSVWGTRWRPENIAVGGMQPPAPADPTYPAYWTPFDQAQGWHNDGYVKFPDPRSTTPSFDTPNYMVKVEKVIGNVDPALRDPDNRDNGKTGALRITTIGLSPDDPTSFYKIVTYKAGPAQSPLTGAMRSVSNWNFRDGGVPTAQANAAGSGLTMTLKNVSASFPPKNFYVVIGDGLPGGTLQSAFVTAASATTLTFATGTSISWKENDHVEMAATLGAPMTVDYDNSGTPDATEAFNLEISTAPDSTPGNMPGSSWVNGGLIVSGNTFFRNLLAPQVPSANVPGQVRASGLIQVVNANAAKFDGAYPGNTVGTPQSLVSSNDADFPMSGDLNALSIISDGANRIANSPNSVRQNKPFTPPSLTDGGNGFGRYRQLTKYSRDGLYDALDDGTADSQQSGAYGYGEGIYINNPQDKERVYDATLTTYREMNQSEFQELIFRNDADANKRYLRLSEPEQRTDDTESLEEQHLRGWVSPSEFRARGALIELDPDNKQVIITKESRTDGRAPVPSPDAVQLYTNEGPVPSQGWYKPDGTDLLGDATYGGVYRQTLPWPENGVIFAEGNIRVRGAASADTIDPGRSLTVVSMNNIYIEGSLNAGKRKVLLLARKNVVVNPTRVLGSIEGQTRLASVPSAGSTTLTVQDASVFKENDWIEIKTTPASLRHRITGINLTTNVITVSPEFPTPATFYTAGQVVQIVHDPLFTNDRPFNQHATRLQTFNDVLQRRLYLAPGTTQVRLAFRHSAQRKDAVTIKTKDPSVSPELPVLDSAEFGNRLVTTPGQAVIQSPEKTLKVTFDQDPGGPGTDTFPNNPTPPGTPPATQAEAIAKKVSDLAADMNGEHPPTQWQYDVTVQSSYDAGTNFPLFYFLAGVGNRFDLLTPPTASLAFPPQKDIKATAGYVIPMATSVSALVNGAAASLGIFDPTTNALVQVKQFGFNPLYIADPTTDAQEDVLTSDQGFYQSGTGDPASTDYAVMQTVDNTYYTLDSRLLTFTGAANGVNQLALRLNNEIVDSATNTRVADYFDATNASIPFYRLSRLKLENADLFNPDGSLKEITPGYTFDIQAFAYAQEGSWLVIPGDYFDQKVKSTYVDLDGNNVLTTNTAVTPNTAESLDLNRDGVVSPDEQVASLRFARYNYQINFKGAIMENQTAIVADPDGTGTEVGAVTEWTDKWATVNYYSTGSPANKFSSIKYEFDPTAAMGTIDSDLTDEDLNNNGIMDPGEDVNTNGVLDRPGFSPPISPELMYQTG